MKRSKFSDAQIAFILCQAEEGTPAPDFAADIARAKLSNLNAGIGDDTPVKRALISSQAQPTLIICSCL